MKLYNTLSRKAETVKPLQDKRIKLYTCGLTVYSQPHIGNWVSYIYWDVLVRTLKDNGYDVTHVQNITDVGHLTSDEDAGEDKMLISALKEGKTAWEVAKKYTKIADYEAFEMLGLLRPDDMPLATDYMPQQIAFVQKLEKKGYTYVLGDGVYFDTSKLKDYGKLAKLDIEGLQFGARVADTGKKNPTDFAVWKFSPKDQKRDMEWDSPWGKGFPGWHLECSVLANELLGEQIDIHTGGIDHIPVHHTNEIAQTEALTGRPFAQTWLHANHIKVNSKKMSKSLGNIVTLGDIQDKGIGIEPFKLMVLSKHYRTEGNFTWDILDANVNTLRNLNEWADLRNQHFTSDALAKDYKKSLEDIRKALADDLDTPKVVAIINSMANKVEELGIDSEAIKQAVFKIEELTGLIIADGGDILTPQKKVLKEREKARKNKDWAKADELRDQLKEEKGLYVRDTAQGQAWTRRR